MASKESKAILKQMRESIKIQNFKEAIEKGEKLLKDDPKNYMANLLMGAAYQNTNKVEAAKYLRKATELSTVTPVVPLQGLVTCAPLEELPKIYEQLIDLVPDKSVEYYEKLYSIGTNPLTKVECFQIFKREFNKRKDEHKQIVMKYLARLWVANDYKVDSTEEHVYKVALEEVIVDKIIDEHYVAYKRYIKLLYDLNDIDNCLKHANLFIEFYPKSLYGFEWICKIFCELKILKHQEHVELGKPIEQYVEELQKLQKNSFLAILVEAEMKYSAKQYVMARDLLENALRIQPEEKMGLELMARIHMKIGAYGLALPLLFKLNLVDSIDYAICLSFDNDFQMLNKAIDLLFELPQTLEVVHALGRCYYKQKEIIPLKELPLSDFSKAEFLMPTDEALNYLMTSNEAEKFRSLVLCAKIQYEMENYGEALFTILKATKKRPYSAECFLILGKIYYKTNDTLRARKCFEKCVSLNPLCEEAVNNLSAIYQELGEEQLNVTLLLNTLIYLKSDSSKHVHYKLGLHYLNVNKWDEAIQSFRTAIKFDIFCMTYWESLGDAYSARGSYYSAIRVFEKILEMDSKNIYAKLQIAIMRTTIRMYTEAIKDFNNLLTEHPDYLPGLKCAAEAHLGLANNLRLDHRYGACKEQLQLAVDLLQRAFLDPKNQNMVWLWRLTASVFLQTAQMPKSLANMEVNGVLARIDTKIAVLDRKDLLNLSTRFYTCALKLKQNTYLWYELAVAFYYSAIYKPDRAQEFIENAKNACKMAIKMKGDRWQNWNLMGVLHLHDEVLNMKLANHCLVQAVNLERKSYVAWTNLGVLYLMLQDIKLANLSFQRAQQSSPIYQNAWIGQAMIAETINEEEEALDLFRHCQQFEYHPESAIGYTHWVCEILSTNKHKIDQFKHAIENMHADVVALDAINWYVQNEEEETTAAAYTMQGYLSARQKLYNIAIKSYLNAAKCVHKVEEKDKCFTSVGFLYMKVNKYEDAINAFNNVSEATFSAIVGLALAYTHCGLHQEAYAVYNSVLKSVADDQDDKAAHILAAMAAMVYASQGERDTKTILYQCVLLKNPPPAALFASCALAILHNDQELANTITNELLLFQDSEEHIADVAYIIAHYYLSTQRETFAFKFLMRRMHIFPYCAKLRKVASKFLLDYFNYSYQYQVPTTRLALAALELSHRLKTKSNFIEDSDTLWLAYRALESVDKPFSMKLLQRAVHFNPMNISAWKALLLSTA